MSNQGIRIDRNDKVWVRYRIKGEHVEVGPYDNAVEALRENIGRSEPPLTPAQGRHILVDAGGPGSTVKE